MTRDEQIEAALALLKLGAEYHREIADAIDQVEKLSRMTELGRPNRRKIDAHIKALKAARDTLPYPDADFTASLSARITRVEKLTSPAWLDTSEPKSRKSSRRIPPRRSAYRQKFAVIEAAGLLEHFGREATLYRDGPWHRLSAILYGDRDIDLYNHMRAYRSL